MTVRELIAVLSAHPPDAEIFREDHEWRVVEIRGEIEPGEYRPHFAPRSVKPRKGLVLR